MNLDRSLLLFSMLPRFLDCPVQKKCVILENRELLVIQSRSSRTG